jgi:hypothetical protein
MKPNRPLSHEIVSKSTSSAADATASPTRIEFDLAKVLTPEELARFTEAAEAAEARSLTEHFLNIALGGKDGRAA